MEIVILIAAAAAVCAAMLERCSLLPAAKRTKNKSRRTVRQPVFCPPHGGKGMKNLGSILYFIAGFLFLLAAWSGSGPAFYAIGACFFALGIASWPKNSP